MIFHSNKDNRGNNINLEYPQHETTEGFKNNNNKTENSALRAVPQQAVRQISLGVETGVGSAWQPRPVNSDLVLVRLKVNPNAIGSALTLEWQRTCLFRGRKRRK